MRYGVWRKARATIALTAPGATTDFTMDVDVDGNAIPRSLEIGRLVVVPTVASIRAIRLYTRAGRIIAPANANYSLNYEDTWGAAPVATDEATYDTTRIIHVDEDQEGNDSYGSIYGQMGVRAAAVASAFLVDIYFREVD